MSEGAAPPVTPPMAPLAALRRYEEVRARLPSARFPAAAAVLRLPTLAQAADRWDGFLLDAFGVLNLGDTPIPGAVARMAELRARGKRLCVLTNAASYTRTEALAKYRRLGFDFGPGEVVSSRDVAARRLDAVAPGARWAVIAAAGDRFDDIPARVTDVIDRPAALEGADAILFLSSARWTDAWQDRLVRALDRRPRPVVVANPDLVAPREGGLSREPGLYAHDLIDRTGSQVHWFGKPFSHAFADAAEVLGLAPQRLAMVGDSPHTDVLGGAAAGMGTVLVAAHGLLAGLDAGALAAEAGIVPDVIVETT